MFTRTNAGRITTIAATMAVVLSAGAAAQTVPGFSSAPAHLGEVTGDPEKDTIGFIVLGQDPCGAVPRFSATPSWVGEMTGDAEKDTFGFTVLRHDGGCPALAVPRTASR
jgi:hypothetical protein